MSELELRQWTERASQARRDLEELGAQLETGDIDQGTASQLREKYEAEAQRADRKARELARSGDTERPSVSRSRSRMILGAGILAVSAVVVFVTFSGFAEQGEDETLQGVAASGDTFDPEAYSNETLEAVISASADDPAVAGQLPYMRFALAERYFEEQNFQSAFVHYDAILNGDPPPDLYSSSLTRLAWIVWVGNGEADLAISLLDRALEADPTAEDTVYVKGQVLWCGAGDAEQAAILFESLLSSTELDEETRRLVEADFLAADAGEPCR